MAKKYWLMKTEPDVYSIDDLINDKNQTCCWEGVRNYQARNFMRDEFQIGDEVLFYHSNTTPPGIVGICKVVKKGYPDHYAFDKKSKYYDPKSNPEKPTWFMVNIKFNKKFKETIPLDELKQNKKLKNMKVIQKGMRLSVQPVTKEEFQEVTTSYS